MDYRCLPKTAEQNGFFEHLGSMIAEFKTLQCNANLTLYEMWQPIKMRIVAVPNKSY